MDWRQQKISNCCKLLSVTLFVFLALASCLYSEHYVFAQTDQTASKLQAANNAIGKAFNAVLDAEKAGGNVTQLLVKLNIAGELLTQAENLYRSGWTANVTSMAGNSALIADQVTNDALSLQNAAADRSQNIFILTLIFSFAGAFIFIIFLMFMWRRFKSSYVKKLLGFKPEGVENAA